MINITEEIAVESARIRHGKKMGHEDAVIPATAHQEGAKIVAGGPWLQRDG